MSILNKIKSFDVYRDIPKDLTEQTISGAIVSIICALFITYLFAAETMSYLTPELSSQFYVDSHIDTGNYHAMLQININISLPSCPCAVISVDAQDVMGGHIVDVGGELRKIRLDRYGRPLLDSKGVPLPSEGNGVDPSLQKGEGCNIYGYMIVKRVPGNFHVSAHAHANLLTLFFADKPMNLSHVIHNLSFGDRQETEFYFDEAGINPLKNSQKIVYELNANEAKSYEYYVKIVPMTYQKLDGNILDSFQYVANSNDILGRYAIPAIYFRYDMSPISVKFIKKNKALSHFLVQLCAIIGGVFTVLGLFSAIVNSSLRQIMKKAEIGKLG